MKGLILGVSALILASCGGSHFLSDKGYRERVHEDFSVRRQMAAGRDSMLFAVMDKGLSTEQREAMEFLYAYMPLCDLAEYDGAFFLRQVDGAFRARDYFKWGVPEDIFRHFVLVHRVNNEYLDESRDVFFEELKDRLRGMDMREAALEVNHWCHEKVNYRGSDPRTSSPLATVRTSWGRCGEESTFTVAALRAVGIPARQCYTPRWVHTDSNHAWVEVWVDGQWHYMGACEPEPELDVAWFDGPVQRAMMTHTTVYGPYTGPEEKNVETPLYSVINTLSVYAPVRRAEVLVVDEAGQAVEGAQVQFKVYNYGELFPMVTLASDAQGRAAIETGMGDVMVWAAKGDMYGYVKSAPGDSLATVVLSRSAGEEYSEEYTMSAPVEQPFEELPAELIAANAVKLAHEDSIRNEYISTFPDSPNQWVRAAWGNWAEIEKFVEAHAADPELERFMRSLREKDLRDTPAAVLEDFYPVNPRIGLELIKPWRSYLQAAFAARPVEEIIRYISENVRISDEDNYYDCRLTPRGVHELGVTDAASRDIYFVALCRTCDITARLDPATAKPQYMADGKWYDVAFETAAAAPANESVLTLTGDEGNLVNPQYGTHFTLARFEGGDFHTLDLRALKLPARVPLSPGYYRVMAASRANDGSVKIAAQYLTIGTQGASAVIKLPELDGKIFVKGVVDMNSVIGKTTLKKLSRGQGAIVIFADPDKEPTKHILQEMPAWREAIEAWGGAVVCMVPDDKRTDAFDPARFAGQPAQTVWADDTGRVLLDATARAIQLPFRNNFPLVVYMTNNGGVLYFSEGYRIGILEDVMRTIKLEQGTR